MNLLKMRIIEEIINQLNSLKTIYKEEIEKIIQDLTENDSKSLKVFINKYYKENEISSEMKQFVTSLVEKEIIPIAYLQKIHKTKNSKTIKTKEEEKNALLRKKIIEARKIYLEDAKGFINKLENQEENVIYDTLLNFSDISLMQHCIKNLSDNTLQKLLIYVSQKLKTNPHSAIDIFLEGSIKNHLKNA